MIAYIDLRVFKSPFNSQYAKTLFVAIPLLFFFWPLCIYSEIKTAAFQKIMEKHLVAAIQEIIDKNKRP